MTDRTPSEDAVEAGVGTAAARVRAALPRRTQRCVLREVGPTDALAVQAYRGLEEVTRYLSHGPLTVPETEETVARWLADPASVTAVAELDRRVVGDVRLMVRPASAMAPAVTSEVECWVGYAFHPDVHGRGLARECVAELVELALSRAGARRVTARVFAPATASSRLLAALGFHLDGVDRQAVLDPSGHTWWDDELWSLLPGDGADEAGRGDPAPEVP